MNKSLIITLSLIAFSSTALACGGDVHMSIPHIHDEADMLNSVKHSELKQTELKQIDIYQIFAGKLEKHHHHNHEVVSHEKEINTD